MKLPKLKFKTIKNNCNKSFLHRISLYLKKGSIKLHIITGDDSEVFHTHPWNFMSFILFGGYKEWIQYDSNDPILETVNPWTNIKGVDTEYFELVNNKHIINPRIRLLYYIRIFSINKKRYNQLHRVELFRLFGIKIPCITIGFYSDKIELCSFCKELGYCKSNKP